jgi:endonuclease
MPIYEKSTKELMKDFARGLKPDEVFTSKAVKDWFAQRYPKIKATTVGMHLEAMSTNCQSRRNYPHIRPDSGHDIFFKVAPGVLRTRTLDHPGLEFPGFVMMAGWLCHHERAM